VTGEVPAGQGAADRGAAGPESAAHGAAGHGGGGPAEIRALAVTVSNRAAAGVYEDRSGPVLARLLAEAGCTVDGPLVVPDGSAVEVALREKRITPAESGRLMRRYEEGLEGYTYLTVND